MDSKNECNFFNIYVKNTIIALSEAILMCLKVIQLNAVSIHRVLKGG